MTRHENSRCTACAHTGRLFETSEYSVVYSSVVCTNCGDAWTRGPFRREDWEHGEHYQRARMLRHQLIVEPGVELVEPEPWRVKQQNPYSPLPTKTLQRPRRFAFIEKDGKWVHVEVPKLKIRPVDSGNRMICHILCPFLEVGHFERWRRGFCSLTVGTERHKEIRPVEIDEHGELSVSRAACHPSRKEVS